MPKEIFELDNDDRWQARLDEARARREIALREKAAGKAQKPRPKPWEIEGAGVEKPRDIEPIIQERGDDKFDFADRLETIREPKPEDTDDAAAPVPTPTPTPTPAAVSKPTAVPSPARPTVTEARPKHSPLSPVEASSKGLTTNQRAPAPEARARPQPSLVLPGAPDVAELAARYAATLDTAAPYFDDDASEPKQKTAELVTLPTATRSVEIPEPEPEQPAVQADRRRGIRPLGMALGLVAFALLPLTTEAPPLETGPGMPQVDMLRVQPALGVTWSLSERPRRTRSGEWVPRAMPVPLAAVPDLLPSAGVGSSVVRPPAPASGRPAAVDWTGLALVSRLDAPVIGTPAAGDSVPVVADAPAPEQVLILNATNGVSAPPRPASLGQGAAVEPTPPPSAVRTETASVGVVETAPLRVTLLVPPRADRSLVDTIAAGVQDNGHELVRTKDVDFSINARNVRYFHEADRASAARMAERFDAELRDFTWFQPRPLAGTVELWLAGRGAPGASSVQAESPRGSGPDDQSALLNRVFDRLGLGTDLPEASPAAGAAAPVPEGTGN